MDSIVSFRRRCNLNKKTNKHRERRKGCFKAERGVYPKDDPPSRRSARGCSEQLSRLVRSSWQLGCCSGHLIWHGLGGRVRVEDVCVAKVILLAETKTTRQGDGCEELAINGWFPPIYGAFLDVKKANLLMEEIRKNSGWKHHEL